MGAWFLCNSLGGYFSGVLTSLVAIPKDRTDDVVQSATAYGGLYGRCSVGLAVVATLMLVATPWVKRLMAAAR
jgi:dipeptide/tripeptide permease